MISIFSSANKIFKNNLFSVIVSLIMYCLVPNISGQEVWTQRSPWPTAENLKKIVFNGSIFVAVGTRGIILTSTDGNYWVHQQSGTTQNLNAIAWGNNQFVAVGDSGTMLTSLDAVIWDQHQLDTMDQFNAIVFGFNKYVVVGANLSKYLGTGIILSSQDGITWIDRITKTDTISALSSLTYGNNGFVAVSAKWGQNILFSSDGVAWTNAGQLQTNTSGVFASGASSVAWGGNQFILVGSARYCYVGYRSVSCSNTFSFASSPDGKNWTIPEPYTELRCAAFCNNEFIGFGKDTSKILTSTDGTAWTITTSRSGFALNDVVWGDSQFVAVGDSGAIFTSPDGATWKNKNFYFTKETLSAIGWDGIKFIISSIGSIQEPFGPYYYHEQYFSSLTGRELTALATTGIDGISSWTPIKKICWGLNRFVAVGHNEKILSSPDGITWTEQTSGTMANLNAVTWNGAQFVAVGAGVILTSPDGITWTNRPISLALKLYDVTWGGDKFAAVGVDTGGKIGKIITSPDGKTWTNQTTGATEPLNGIAYGDNQFVTVGDSGRILTSPDGSTWTNSNSVTTRDLEQITYGNGYFVAIGSKGTIIVSPDGKLWTAKNMNVSADLNAIVFNGNLFIAVGGNGVILTSSTNSNSISYQPGRSRMSQNQFFHISDKAAHYFLPQYSDVSIILYNLQGRFVKTLLKCGQMPGVYCLPIPSSLAQGRYIISLRAGQIKIDKTIIIAR